eukprot:CAMPEP_0178988022 /NCGR_PEP_ID=MMETSP0795-20121207/3587_1 /TAXON_ID=88552 /ORGANISM="Amoebophrya sp., Strain Ameob2" /LENGTH=978 /DNA_ID=CAMNT_0020679265 /DNA_START=193 /DNA_END=3130 /DNA_ORIENTATION=-
MSRGGHMSNGNPSYSKPSARSIRDLFKDKETEMQSLHAAHFQELEEVIHKREQDVCSLRHDFARLQNDFKYNLSLLEERDKELSLNDVQLGKLQAKLAERETLVLTLQEHLTASAGDTKRDLGEKDREIASVLSQCEKLQLRIGELEAGMEKMDQVGKEQMDKLRASKDAQLVEQQKRHETRLSELQQQYRGEVATKHTEQNTKDALYAAEVSNLQQKVSDLTRELSTATSEREYFRSAHSELQAKWQMGEKNRGELVELLEKTGTEGERALAKCDGENKVLKSEVENLERRCEGLAAEVRTLKREKQEELQTCEEGYGRKLKATKESGMAEVEALKADSNRRIREMERLCVEKIANVEREWEVKCRAIRDELERRVEDGKRDQVIAIEEQKRSTREEIEEKWSVKTAGLELKYDREREDWGLKMTEKEEKIDSLKREMEEMRRKYSDEQRRGSGLCGELDLLRAEKEDESLTHKREIDRLQAELEFHRSRAKSSPSKMKESFDPLFSGDFGQVLLHSAGSGHGRGSINKSNAASAATLQLEAPDVEQGGESDSPVRLPRVDDINVQDNYDNRNRMSHLALKERENADLRAQVESYRDLIAQMRQAAEAKGGLSSTAEDDLEEDQSVPLGRVVATAQSRAEQTAARMFEENRFSENAVVEPREADPDVQTGPRGARSALQLNHVKQKYEELLECKEKEIHVLSARVAEVCRDSEKLRTEKAQLMELSNKLKYEKAAALQQAESVSKHQSRVVSFGSPVEQVVEIASGSPAPPQTRTGGEEQSKLYAVEQALRNLERQNALLRNQLVHGTLGVQEQHERGGGGGGRDGGGRVDSAAATPRGRSAGSSSTCPPPGNNESLIARARERVEHAKLELNGQKVDIYSVATPRGPPGGPEKDEGGTEKEGGGTAKVAKRPQDRTPSTVSAPAEKLRLLQKKRQDQRLKAVRNWANVPPPEEQNNDDRRVEDEGEALLLLATTAQ